MNVGEQLLKPEKGWKRYDDLDLCVEYVGSGWKDDPSYTPYSGTRRHITQKGGHEIRFNFTGSNLRIIGCLSTNWSDGVEIEVDGIKELFSQHGSMVISQILNYQKLNMEKREHTVIITNTKSGYWGLDAIDIDEGGRLKIYNTKPGLKQRLYLSGDKTYGINEV